MRIKQHMILYGLILGLGLPVHAQTRFNLRADQLSGDATVQTLRGNVLLRHDDGQITADEAVRRYADDHVTFEGDVELQASPDTLRAPHLTYARHERVGRAEEGLFFANGEVSVWADRGQYTSATRIIELPGRVIFRDSTRCGAMLGAVYEAEPKQLSLLDEVSLVDDRLKMLAGAGAYDQERRFTHLADSVALRWTDTEDTLWLQAATVDIDQSSDTLRIAAYGSTRFTWEAWHGTADTLRYQRVETEAYIDEIMTLLGRPMVDTDEQAITGSKVILTRRINTAYQNEAGMRIPADTISAGAVSGPVNWRQQAWITSQSDQVAADSLYIAGVSTNAGRLHFHGSVRSTFHPEPKTDSDDPQRLTMEAQRMVGWVADGRLTQLRAYDDVTGEIRSIDRPGMGSPNESPPPQETLIADGRMAFPGRLSSRFASYDWPSCAYSREPLSYER